LFIKQNGYKTIKNGYVRFTIIQRQPIFVYFDAPNVLPCRLYQMIKLILHESKGSKSLKAMLHGAIFLATCNAILLLRDVKLPNTSLHYTPLRGGMRVFPKCNARISAANYYSSYLFSTPRSIKNCWNIFRFVPWRSRFLKGMFR
jgi:hypothetical protein